MKNLTTLFVIFVATLGVATAQVAGVVVPPVATGAVWLDVFANPRGVVVTPQYAWGVKLPGGKLGGFHFAETAPRARFFMNNLVWYTPARLPQFSVHTETGGEPRSRLGFFQVGPRLNIGETIPAIKRPMNNLSVVVLPRFIGIQPNNLLIAGATNRFSLTPGIKVSAEGFRRFAGGHRPDYGEYWFLVHPKKTGRVSFALHLLHDGNRAMVSAGIRISQ